MKYLSFDIEATGLKEFDYIIEFAMVPFDITTGTLEKNLARSYYIKCPTYKELEPKLDPWVVEHNKELIIKANKEGLPMNAFKNEFQAYLESSPVKDYFATNDRKIVLFGKSINAIDLPFLNRDLGFDFMRRYFHHQVLDLSSVAMSFVDSNMIPEDSSSGSNLMKYFKMGDVEHTALADAINTAIMYIKLIEKFKT
ncbi:MAG: hypothetical protein DRQ88_11450 [Epsilonproteobacteria bacterium]|nr:MAG: hypothetical protein DRQ88_11450 [Campylobacterota bacterium]RLA64943.1 MAG: hypothetical protein DRQ89_02660 [Campylobacterota bacterium]